MHITHYKKLITNLPFVAGHDDIELVPPDTPTDPWIIRSVRIFDREADNETRPDLIDIVVECKLHTPQGKLKSVSKALTLNVLDVDDNSPESQESKLNIELKTGIVAAVSLK